MKTRVRNKKMPAPIIHPGTTGTGLSGPQRPLARGPQIPGRRDGEGTVLPPHTPRVNETHPGHVRATQPPREHGASPRRRRRRVPG